jgi:copper resistance protein D
MVPAWPLVLARLLLLSSLGVQFGSSLFFLYALKETEDGDASGWPRRMLLTAALVAVLASLGWLVAETISMTDQPLLQVKWASFQEVAMQTRFGQIALARAGVAALALISACSLPSSRSGWSVQAVLSGVALAGFAWTGHGTLGDGGGRLIHLGADVVHLLAAGLWIGALFPLAVLLIKSVRKPTLTASHAAVYGLDRFSGIGAGVVALLVLTGIINSAYVIGVSRWREIFTSVYGQLMVFKLALFAAMLLFAAANRYHLAPRLRTALEQSTLTSAALRPLRQSVVLETCLAVGVLAVVALFGVLEPPVSEVP